MSERQYHCGSLTYAKMGLATLFAWLLWGDFCFTLMETVGPSVLPLKLKALGASNTTMSWIMTVLPNILSMTINPWVSFKSDRYRSRWGRRIPFILWTLPFLTISLISLGWSENLSAMARHALPALASVAPATVTIWMIAIFLIIFQFFNNFVNSVFWYLFNDVVPPQFLGRFMGLFRMMGTAAGALYNFFIFRYAESNMREIITGGALLYFVGFGVMCFFVKEGSYPPPPEMDAAPSGFTRFIKAFGRQSFSNRFYWYFYLMNSFASMATACAFASIFFSRQMGLSLAQIGKLSAFGSIATLAATYFTAIFVDRWHPLRISAYMAVFVAVTGFSGWVWTTMTLPGDIFFWLCLGGSLVTVFSANLQDACSIPLFMRLMPKSLYGQFSAANAMIRSATRILAGILAGPFLDLLRFLCGGSDFAYRWMFLWVWVFNIAVAVFTCLGYREWKRLGGDDNYCPPASWLPEGREAVTDRVVSVAAQPRIVLLALWLVIGGTVINLVFVACAMWLMRQHHMLQALAWHAEVFIPLLLLLLGMQAVQLVHVRRDIVAAGQGRATRMGVPHHGVLLVIAIQGVVGLSIYWYQTLSMLRYSFERELIIFSVAFLLSTLAGIAGIQIIRWVERDPVRERFVAV